MEMTLKEVLNRTGAVDIHCSFSQVAELIGEEAAEELAISKTGLGEKRALSRGPGSTVNAAKAQTVTDLSRFNRLALLKAIGDKDGSNASGSNAEDEKRNAERQERIANQAKASNPPPRENTGKQEPKA